MVTLTDIIEKEEDGNIFTRLPDSLDSSTLLKLIHLDLPERAVINGIEYDLKAAEFFKGLSPRTLGVLYYMSLGNKYEGITQKMGIKKSSVQTHLIKFYDKIYIPNDKNKHVSVSTTFQKTFPHIFPVQQYEPIKLTNRQYEVAQKIAEGYSNTFISTELGTVIETIKRHENEISLKIRDQLPNDYNLRVHIANLFNSGVFYSKSNNPAGIGLQKSLKV